MCFGNFCPDACAHDGVRINSNAFYCGDWNYVSPLAGIRMMGDAPLMANDAFTGVKATVYYSANNATCTRGQIVSFPYRAYK